MKIKHIVLASTILVSVSAFAQKEELKALKKIYAKEIPSANDLAEYKTNLTKLESLATEEGDKVYATFYKSMLPLLQLASYGTTVTPVQVASAYSPKVIADLATGLNATLDYEKKTGKKVYTDDINETITSFKPDILNLAIALGQKEKFQEASDVLYALYLLDKKNQDNLYYAASYAVNAKSYDRALEHYNTLKSLNYTGEATVYYAMNKTTKQEESFPSKENRDLFMKAGTHEKPREEKLESRRGEIFKNIALILVEKGKVEEAKAAVAEARKANPEDTSLILTEADLYLKMNDFATYTKLVNEALAKNPNNVDLIYNLGVISANANNLVDAEKHYKRAIEIDSNYFNAYINLAELRLRADQKIIDEMSKLGTSDKDNKKYEQLKVAQLKIYQEVLPYLEKAVEIDGTSQPAKKTLLSVYGALEMTEKAKALKAKM